MDKKLKVMILKSGGKRALAEYNKAQRGPDFGMNLGTRTHESIKHKKPKHKDRATADEAWSCC